MRKICWRFRGPCSGPPADTTRPSTISLAELDGSFCGGSGPARRAGGWRGERAGLDEPAPGIVHLDRACSPARQHPSELTDRLWLLVEMRERHREAVVHWQALGRRRQGPAIEFGGSWIVPHVQGLGGETHLAGLAT